MGLGTRAHVFRLQWPLLKRVRGEFMITAFGF
jgi:hypothetical protein